MTARLLIAKLLRVQPALQVVSFRAYTTRAWLPTRTLAAAVVAKVKEPTARVELRTARDHAASKLTDPRGKMGS